MKFLKFFSTLWMNFFESRVLSIILKLIYICVWVCVCAYMINLINRENNEKRFAQIWSLTRSLVRSLLLLPFKFLLILTQTQLVVGSRLFTFYISRYIGIFGRAHTHTHKNAIINIYKHWIKSMCWLVSILIAF